MGLNRPHGGEFCLRFVGKHYMVLKVHRHFQKGIRTRAGTRGYSSAGRAPALQAGGHRFESVYLHHLKESGAETGSGQRRGLIAQQVRAHA